MTLHASSIDNGQRVLVETLHYTGRTGVSMLSESTGEFAFHRKRRVRGLSNDSGTVDGRPVHITSVRESESDSRLAVVRFEFVEEAAA